MNFLPLTFLAGSGGMVVTGHRRKGGPDVSQVASSIGGLYAFDLGNSRFAFGLCTHEDLSGGPNAIRQFVRLFDKITPKPLATIDSILALPVLNSVLMPLDDMPEARLIARVPVPAHFAAAPRFRMGGGGLGPYWLVEGIGIEAEFVEDHVTEAEVAATPDIVDYGIAEIRQLYEFRLTPQRLYELNARLDALDQMMDAL